MKNAVGVLFFFSSLLHFICNMIIFFIFTFALCHRLFTANLCKCVCVYLVWKIALNFLQRISFLFYVTATVHAVFSSLPLSLSVYLFRSIHIYKKKSSTGNQKRINTKIKRYHRFVHVLLPCERMRAKTRTKENTNKLEYSLRRQFVCIRRVRFFLYFFPFFFFTFTLFAFYRTVRAYK